jgi:hypothetical protein
MSEYNDDILAERNQMPISRNGIPRGLPGEGTSANRVRTSFMKVTAAQRLAQLGFDPMMELIGVFREAEQQIAVISGIDNRGNVVGRPERARSSGMVVASMLQTKAKIATDLLRYQHSRVNESAMIEVEQDITPVSITLTGLDTEAQSRIAIKHNIVKQSDVEGEEIDAFELARKAAGHED